ncbi:Choline-sulfatase [Symmachiella macrocystis]|uniref:Choline-sulfatase n=1 Tax=Symmachiella macrocystis TaxID=2527985 RepID=A0A5C6BHR7_9PLAN|nr:sulfatase [Symmachiella macrocystis]TWU11520.1 Choline-sulfatase [Symmachiella macrocystis]
MKPLALCLLALFALPVNAQAKPPNVVMIISDDQAWTDFGFMGHRDIKTPNLDQLARESAVFTRGYVPASLCRPSLATMITGLYPHQHKISGNDPPKGTDRQLMLKHIQNAPTLPRLLGKQGYRSHQSGKWWEGNYRLGGFTAGMTHGDPKHGGRHGDDGLKIGRQGMEPIFDFIRESNDEPFFLWYAPFLPHSPHNPPERLLKKYEKPGRSIHVARYYAMCEWFDETCGELLDFLDKNNLADDTLVVFVTDNGWIQSTDSRRYAPKSKRSQYDGGVRTPIMLCWPGKIAPGENTTLASSIDLAPTILKACGIDPPTSMPGIDLVSVAAGHPTKRTAIHGEIFAHDIADIDSPRASLLYRWVIQGHWKLIVPADESAGVELYDLDADPHETKNLAADHADKVRELTANINDWWAAQ